jgi:hypothetical protein
MVSSEELTPAGMQQQLLYASISKLNSRLQANREQLQRLSYGNCVKIERQIVKQKKP